MPEKYSEWSYNITTSSIPRPSKLYPNWDFWFENKPSGNPGEKARFTRVGKKNLLKEYLAMDVFLMQGIPKTKETVSKDEKVMAHMADTLS
jgi:hypothetical protein